MGNLEQPASLLPQHSGPGTICPPESLPRKRVRWPCPALRPSAIAHCLEGKRQTPHLGFPDLRGYACLSSFSLPSPGPPHQPRAARRQMITGAFAILSSFQNHPGCVRLQWSCKQLSQRSVRVLIWIKKQDMLRGSHGCRVPVCFLLPGSSCTRPCEDLPPRVIHSPSRHPHHPTVTGVQPTRASNYGMNEQAEVLPVKCLGPKESLTLLSSKHYSHFTGDKTEVQIG